MVSPCSQRQPIWSNLAHIWRQSRETMPRPTESLRFETCEPHFSCLIYHDKIVPPSGFAQSKANVVFTSDLDAWFRELDEKKVKAVLDQYTLKPYMSPTTDPRLSSYYIRFSELPASLGAPYLYTRDGNGKPQSCRYVYNNYDVFANLDLVQTPEQLQFVLIDLFPHVQCTYVTYRKVMSDGRSYETLYGPDTEATNFVHPRMMLPDADLLRQLPTIPGINKSFLYFGSLLC